MPKLLHLVRACAGVWLLASSASALAVNQNITIELPASSVKSLPYYAVRLPMALYPLSANSQLPDLKIRNAKGDFLHYAWLDSTTETLKIESHALPFFPVLASTNNEGQNREIIALDILRQTDGSLIAKSEFKPPLNASTSVRSWIIDASKLNSNARLVQARVRIDKSFQGIAPVKLEASEDFKNWTSLGGVEQLVQLQHQGEQIQKLSLDLGHRKAKYLRLSLQTSSQQSQIPPKILAIEVDTQEQELVSPKMQWTEVIQAHQCNVTSCEYHVPKNTPIDSLRLYLQEKNTLAKVQIFGELSPSVEPAAAHRHFRNPLYVLRHQKQASSTPTAQDIFLGDTTAYRLNLPDGEISSDDLSLGGYALNKIRLQIPAGIKSLGTQTPTISLGSLSRHLAFLARGDEPYRIEFANDKRGGAAVDLNTLMPQVNLREMALPFAEIRTQSLNTVQGAFNNTPSKTPTENSTTSTQKRYWLWATLVVALAVIGAMVWSLLRNIDKENR
jgi:hypothetical protein